MGVHCLQTFWQVTACRVIGPYLCVNFRPVPLTVFEMQGFKLKNKNNDKTQENVHSTAVYTGNPLYTCQRNSHRVTAKRCVVLNVRSTAVYTGNPLYTRQRETVCRIISGLRMRNHLSATCSSQLPRWRRDG